MMYDQAIRQLQKLFRDTRLTSHIYVPSEVVAAILDRYKYKEDLDKDSYVT